jgi:hypothetical protein
MAHRRAIDLGYNDNTFRGWIAKEEEAEVCVQTICYNTTRSMRAARG